MRRESSLISLNLDGNLAVKRLSNRLICDGMHVIRSFDLQTAKAAYENYPCPHHGVNQCDCQLIVMFVYDDHGSQLKIIAYSKDQKSHFSIIDPPLDDREQKIKDKILQALSLISFSNFTENDPIV